MKKMKYNQLLLGTKVGVRPISVELCSACKGFDPLILHYNGRFVNDNTLPEFCAPYFPLGYLFVFIFGNLVNELLNISFIKLTWHLQSLMEIDIH